MQNSDTYESPSTPLSSIKNKKRVHYPYTNGEQPVKETSDVVDQEKPTTGRLFFLLLIELFCIS